MRQVPATILLTMLFAGCDAPEVRLTPPPVTVQQETPGQGRVAKPGDIVAIDYRVSLPDGSEVLRADGFRFQVGRGAVIAGIDEVVQGMRAGGRRVISCPPHLHWGRAGYGDGAIPPNTTLTIDIRLVRIET